MASSFWLILSNILSGTDSFTFLDGGSTISTSSSKLIFVLGTIPPSLSYEVQETAKILRVDHQKSSPVSLFVRGNSLLIQQYSLKT